MTVLIGKFRAFFPTKWANRFRCIGNPINLLCFTCPTYTLAKADPIKQEAFKEEFKVIKKKLLNEEIDRILFEDESMIRDYQALSRTWFAKGQQKVIPTYGKHWGAKLIGTLDYETGEVFCVQEEQYTAKEFLSFLEKVTAKY